MLSDKQSQSSANNRPLGGTRELTDEERAARNEDIIRRYLANEPLQSIGDDYGLTRQRIDQIVREHDIPPRKRITASERFAREHGKKVHASFVRLRDPKAVARETGLPLPKVKSYLKDIGLAKAVIPATERRGRGEKYPDDEVMAGLREAYESGITAGKPLSAAAYDQWRRDNGKDVVSSIRIIQRYGSWRDAVEKAGVPANQPNRGSYHATSQEKCLNALVSYVKEEFGDGNRPTAQRYDLWSRDHDDAPSLGTVRKAFGGKWKHALDEARKALAGPA